MDLYTLSPTFLADQVVDEYASAIWTERYSAAGDTQLVVPATQKNIDLLAEGTFLALRGSKEVMQLQTQSIDKGMMTVVGTSLVGFLNERQSWFSNPGTTGPSDRISDYTRDTLTPGNFIAYVVERMVIDPLSFTGDWADANLDWGHEVIPGLELGAVDDTGPDKRLTVTVGPLYDAIAQVAMKEGVGISLYLDSADPVTGYVLKFTTYRGQDRTSAQSTNPVIRLSPELNSISDLKEVRSIANFKNVAYVYYQGEVTEHLLEPSEPEPEGFDRRVLVTNAEGEPVGRKVTGSSGYSYTVVGSGEIAAFREQNARDELANHNYIRALDGQTSPHNDYKYGVDYGLGDVIELEGTTGLISNARVTEYIRSDDQQGEREYPTISVIS